MLIAKTLTSWNSSASNCTTASLLHVEIITLALYCGLDPGGLFYVQPAFEEALRDIGRLYPCVRARHNIISVPEECTDVGLTPFAHDLLGQFYYRNFARWEAANVTSFLTNTADIFGQAAAVLALNTQKLHMSVVPPDLQGKAKWPTRITMGARATGSRTVSVSVLSLCQFYNWSTIVLACDEPENGRSCSTAQAVKRDLAAVLSDVEIVVFDGFTPSFNYIAALTVLSEKARVVIYSGMSKQAMRNILITAYNLNMTNGEYVRHVRGSDWAPRDYIFSEIKGALPLTSVVLG